MSSALDSIASTAPGSANASRASQSPVSPSRKRRMVRDSFFVVGAWLVSGGFFFSSQWTSGFDRIMGNAGDTQLMVYLNEQWFLVLRGAQPWRNPPFFYPVKGLLGYSDTFFLWQFFFAPLRILGAEPYLAFQLTIVILSFLGFISFVVLARWILRAPLFVAIIGAIVFTFANNLAEHVGSAQVFGIYFVPMILLIGVLSWRLRHERLGASVLLAMICGGLWGLLLFSTYYAAWFALLSGGLVALITFLISPRTMSAATLDAIKTGWQCMLAALIGFAVGMVPFFMTYLPIANQLGTRSYVYAMSFAPRFRDLINVGVGNRYWGQLLHHVWSPPSTNSYVFSFAITPILSLTILTGAVVVVWAVATRRRSMTSTTRFTLALCVTSLLLTILPINTWVGSGWILVWHVPGATAIRAIRPDTGGK